MDAEKPPKRQKTKCKIYDQSGYNSFGLLEVEDSQVEPDTVTQKNRRKIRKKNERRLLAKYQEELSKNIDLLHLLSTENKSTDNRSETKDTINLTNLTSLNSAINYTYVADKVTKIFDLNNRKFYGVGEILFSDQENILDEEYYNFELYKMSNPVNFYVNKELTEADLTEALYMTIQPTKSGYIINNNVYLTREKWHTLIKLTEELYSCAVCQLQCDKLILSEHIESPSHSRNLSVCSPLKKFDLSIVRKINENLHCGVCNTLFSILSYNEHENLKSHEENLLSCINRISDMFDDATKTTQKFNANNIKAPNNAPCVQRQEITNLKPRESLENQFNNEMFGILNFERIPQNFNRIPQSVEEIPESIDRIPQIYNSIPHSFDVIPEIPEYFYEIPDSNKNVPKSDGRHVTESKMDDSYDYDEQFKGNVYNIRIYEEVEDRREEEEYTLPIEGISYANMASKPKLELPRFLEIDLGTKVVRVKYENWHMITLTQPKELYCMLCNELFPVRHKQAHCLSEAHKSALAKCTVVGAFEGYLIRDVNDKLYHCGHCNNLQFKSDMRIHIEKYHPIANSNKSIEAMAYQTQTDTQTDTQNDQKKLFVLGYFKFSPFGAIMIVSNLAYHTIMTVAGTFYCAICDVMTQAELIDHVYERTHMQLINMTPYIKPFQCNLTRAIRGSLHCTICNILVPVEGIEDHNISTTHTDLLARALGMVKNERPRHEVKYIRENEMNFEADINKFLATLPADTRDLLSRLQIKNNKGETFVLNDIPSSINTTELESNNSPKQDFPPLGMNPHNSTPENSNTHLLNPKVYPKSVVDVKTFHPSQMIPLSVLEESLGVKPKLPMKIGEEKLGGLTNLSESGVNDLKKSKNENIEKNEQKKSKENGKTKVSEKKMDVNSDDDESPFVPNNKVLVKLKSSYFEITESAYHTLVPLGAGIRRCCACLTRLEAKNLRTHVRSRIHRRTIQGHTALHYTGQLIRQMYHTYHCAFCNVTMSRSEVEMHLNWPQHKERHELSLKKLTKKDLKDLSKHVKEISVETQKMPISNVLEPIHIITYVTSTREEFPDNYIEETYEKKSQMIIIEGNMMKIGFESWHGVLVTKNGIKCIICQHELTTEDLQTHLDTKNHSKSMVLFENQFYPALIRKINNNTVNCVTCNLEVPNDVSLILEHIQGRKHVKNHNTIITKSSLTDSYSDCYKYPITL